MERLIDGPFFCNVIDLATTERKTLGESAGFLQTQFRYSGLPYLGRRLWGWIEELYLDEKPTIESLVQLICHVGRR